MVARGRIELPTRGFSVLPFQYEQWVHEYAVVLNHLITKAIQGIISPMSF